MDKKRGIEMYHRFLDEAGDTTFYGRGKVRILGNEGVSKCFILGMLKIREPLQPVRDRITSLQNKIAVDPYFLNVPSIAKKKNSGGYYLHAKDDIPEVRKEAFGLINSIDCSFEAVVGRKIYSVFESKHSGSDAEFYADLLSHLLKNKLNAYEKLVLNISHRSRCTSHNNLNKGLEKAMSRTNTKYPEKSNSCKVVFNVQFPSIEPLLNIADYFCWSVQRVFERGETRYYDFISDKVSLIVDLYDMEKKLESNRNYYTRKIRLTRNNIIKLKKPEIALRRFLFDGLKPTFMQYRLIEYTSDTILLQPSFKGLHYLAQAEKDSRY